MLLASASLSSWCTVEACPPFWSGAPPFWSCTNNACLACRYLRPPAGQPGRVSYGFYLTLVSAINFGLWIVAVVVALLIAAQLCWLLLAFMFEAALLRGVKPIDAPIPPQVRRVVEVLCGSCLIACSCVFKHVAWQVSAPQPYYALKLGAHPRFTRCRRPSATSAPRAA